MIAFSKTIALRSALKIKAEPPQMCAQIVRIIEMDTVHPDGLCRCDIGQCIVDKHTISGFQTGLL